LKIVPHARALDIQLWRNRSCKSALVLLLPDSMC